MIKVYDEFLCNFPKILLIAEAVSKIQYHKEICYIRKLIVFVFFWILDFNK